MDAPAQRISSPSYYSTAFVSFRSSSSLAGRVSHGPSESGAATDVRNKDLLKLGRAAALVDTRPPLMMG